MKKMTRKEFFGVGAKTVAGAVSAPALLSMASADLHAQAAKGAAAPVTGVTADVVRFISSARLDAFPADVVREGKRCLVDGFAVMLAGSALQGSRLLRDYAKANGGKAEATVVGAGGLRGPAELVALVNGAYGHAMDFDDTQLSTTPDRTFGLLTHPTVPALASSLAVAEAIGATGAQFFEAFLVGFEVECKVAEAVNPAHYNRGFHTTGTIGAFAAAAATAKLLKQDPAQLAHTLAIISSLSAGIRVNFGTMTKPLHAGRAAQNGVFAASIASRGFTGGADGLDGPWGFFQVIGGGADAHRIAGALGKPFSIVNPGVSVKPYPCGSLSHPTMDAMLKVVVDHDIKPAQVEKIRVRAGSNILEPLRYKTAKTELEAKFCLPFLMTALVVRRRAGIREFTDEFVASDPVQKMMPLVENVFDQEIEAKGFDKMRSVIEVYLKDGRKLVQPADERYRGGPEKPFTPSEMKEKFADCASVSLPAARIEQALATIEAVDRAKDVKELVASLTA